MGKGTPSDSYPAMPGMVGRQGTARFIFTKCFVHGKACRARDEHSCPRPGGPVLATPSLFLWPIVLVQQQYFSSSRKKARNGRVSRLAQLSPHRHQPTFSPRPAPPLALQRARQGRAQGAAKQASCLLSQDWVLQEAAAPFTAAA